MSNRHRYGRIERERRFLLGRFPAEAAAAEPRRIIDRYIGRTRLRLRRQIGADGSITLKLTQKIPAHGSGWQQGFITTMYLSEEEYRLLSQLPSREIRKARYSAPPFGIDVFEGVLRGLILAEAEFDSAPDAEGLALPPFVAHEVSFDARFTGGRLASATAQDVEALLSEYGVRSTPPAR